MTTRWGICSAGKISSDFVTALRTLPADEHQVCAVAARRLESASDFSQKFSIAKSYGSYEELSADPNVDIVYIGSIHTEHHRLCLLFLNAGKHILCEKPISLNTKQATEIFSLAKEKKLFAMEGLWSRFFPIYTKIRQELAAGSLGEVKFLSSSFGASALHVERLYDVKLGGGALLDLGIYPVQFACVVFNNERPQQIIATGFTHHHSGVDETVSLTLLYSGQRMATISTSIAVCTQDVSFICGSSGAIEICEPAHCPTKCCIKGQEYEVPLQDEDPTKYNFVNSAGMIYQARAVRDSLLKGELENPLALHEHSLMIMSILDEARRQLGVRYQADD